MSPAAFSAWATTDVEINLLCEIPTVEAIKGWPLKPNCCATGFESKLAAFLSAMPFLGTADLEILLQQLWLYLDAHTRMFRS